MNEQVWSLPANTPVCLTAPLCCGLCGVLIHTYHCKSNVVCGRRMAWPTFASQTEHTGHVCIILGAATMAYRLTGHVCIILGAATMAYRLTGHVSVVLVAAQYSRLFRRSFLCSYTSPLVIIAVVQCCVIVSMVSCFFSRSRCLTTNR
jgi:hypothetical protein